MEKVTAQVYEAGVRALYEDTWNAENSTAHTDTEEHPVEFMVHYGPDGQVDAFSRAIGERATHWLSGRLIRHAVSTGYLRYEPVAFK